MAPYKTTRTTTGMLPSGCLIKAMFPRTSLASRFYSAALDRYCLYMTTCLWCVCMIACRGPGEVILYYCYCQIKEPRIICDWQNKLCSKLRLTGKVNSMLFSFFLRYCCGTVCLSMHDILFSCRYAWPQRALMEQLAEQKQPRAFTSRQCWHIPYSK